MKYKSNGLFKQWVSPDVELEKLSECAFTPNLLSEDIVVIDDCYFFASMQPRMVAFIPDKYIIDRTGKECFHNKIHIDDISLSASPTELVKCGLYFAMRLAQTLQSGFEDTFNVIFSYDKEDCVVRFHRVRMNENWLNNNLENYKQEAVLLITT